VEDPEPFPVIFFEVDKKTGDIKVDKLKSILPRITLNDEFARMT